ncbi:N-acetylmuramoyl-L-alanine amidase [Marinococcus halotolerans]|uniref:N-acetylmuramoyl-L-alanine amidase n=1 Tax=Marinococcus halotolerans TaxID=301092 RepID=UPI0003B41323|nr:peptidoglycan-binding protein [Marinococcus halotolerans]
MLPIGTALVLASIFPLYAQTAEGAGETLEEGDSGGDVKELQKTLNGAGFEVTENPTTYFGPKTSGAVEEFQKENGLIVDGIAGPNTWEALGETDESSAASSDELQEGDSNEHVAELQRDLNEAGFHVTDTPTTYFGPKTREAVQEFQRTYQLQDNGTADEGTLEELNTVLNNSGSASASGTYKSGDDSEYIKELQKDLNEAGFHVTDEPTTYFGPLTETSVENFQKAEGLTIDGVAGANTLEELEEVGGKPESESEPENETEETEESENTASLSIGKSSERIQALQEDLNEAGFHVTDEPTTYFGPKTEKAVEEFQEENDLTTDGAAGTKTLSALEGVLESKEEAEEEESEETNTSNDLLSINDEGEEVQALQEQLNEAGFHVTDQPTTYFGPQTKAAVEEFQQEYELSIDGVAGPETLTKLDEVQEEEENTDPGVLKAESTGQAVVDLQKDLHQLEYYQGKYTEEYDSETSDAVAAFQREYGLAIDGIAGPNTLEAIDGELNQSAPGTLRGKTVVIDPGHGGYDGGAAANGLEEKDIVLDTGMKLKRDLEAMGATVVMTRESDRYLSLDERTQVANNADADAFVSVHVNAGGGVGDESYWYGEHEAERSERLAEDVQERLIEATGAVDRGVHEGNFQVIRDTDIPAILAEIGFIDSSTDAANLSEEDYLDDTSEGLTGGVDQFFEE